MAETDTTQPVNPPVDPMVDNQVIPIPKQQPLFFYTNLAESFHLPGEYTLDENTHLPKGILNTLTQGRGFQKVNIRAGEAGDYEIQIHILNKDSEEDLTGDMISFSGRDSKNCVFRTDEGFDTTNANLGYITWKPEAVIAQNPGKFKSAHFIIEKVDRSSGVTTLDFSLEIIDNDVAFPEAVKFYYSEYTRALFNLKSMQNSQDEQLSYQLTFYAQVIADRLKSLTNQMNKDAADALKKNKDDLDASLSDGKAKIDKLVADSTARKTEIDNSLDDLETRQKKNDDDVTQNKVDIAANADAIKSAGVVTQDTAKTVIQGIFDTGDLTVGDSDAAVNSKLDQIEKTLKGEM